MGLVFTSVKSPGNDVSTNEKDGVIESQDSDTEHILGTSELRLVGGSLLVVI